MLGPEPQICCLTLIQCSLHCELEDRLCFEGGKEHLLCMPALINSKYARDELEGHTIYPEGQFINKNFIISGRVARYVKVHLRSLYFIQRIWDLTSFQWKKDCIILRLLAVYLFCGKSSSYARLLRDSPRLTTAGSPPSCQDSGSVISYYCQANLMALPNECVVLEAFSGWFRKRLNYTLWLAMWISGSLTKTRWIIIFDKEVETLLFLIQFLKIFASI